jgi:hypothetical protein
MPKGVLLDTSFFLRFLNEKDPLFTNADGYFRYFIDKQIAMLISTISIAEYCVKGDIHELPLKNLQILPFNIDHAKRAGGFARIVFDQRGTLSVSQRAVIPNDTKLFAQADSDVGIELYLSSDGESRKVFGVLKKHATPRFQFIDLHDPHAETFGILDLK